MRKRRIVLLALIVLLMLTATEVRALAVTDGFETDPMTEEEIASISKNIYLVASNKEPTKRGIECFDVNDQGIIAIGIEDDLKKTVCLYDGTDFLMAYHFNTDGSFGVEWRSGLLVIYFVRGDIAVTISENGEILSMESIPRTTENNTYWNHHVFATKRTVGNNQYILKNDLGFFNSFASSHSQLVLVSESGEETILYDVSDAQRDSMLNGFIYWFVFFVLVVVMVIGAFRTARKQSKGGSLS